MKRYGGPTSRNTVIQPFCEHEPGNLNEPYWVDGQGIALLRFSVWLLNTTLVEASRPLLARSSYGMKHVIEHLVHSEDLFLDGYMTNGQFKFAMEAAGYSASRTDGINWHYNISKASPFFMFPRGSFAEVYEKYIEEYGN